MRPRLHNALWGVWLAALLVARRGGGHGGDGDDGHDGRERRDDHVDDDLDERRQPERDELEHDLVRQVRDRDRRLDDGLVRLLLERLHLRDLRDPALLLEVGVEHLGDPARARTSCG